MKPSQIGTSAAIVNGIMFLVGGIMISRPGVPICLAIEARIVPKSLELAQYAARPLMVAIVLALAIASAMGETYPKIFPMRLSWYETTGRNQINQEADNV
jgi:hypothetical protein